MREVVEDEHDEYGEYQTSNGKEWVNHANTPTYFDTSARETLADSRIPVNKYGNTPTSIHVPASISIGIK